MSGQLRVFAIASLLVTACAQVSGGETGGSGGNTATETTSTTITTDTTSSTTTNPSCDGWFGIDTTVEDATGTLYTCAAPWVTITVESDGVVTAASGGHVEVDTCAPGTACDPAIVKIDVTAKGLELPLPTGTLVHVRADVYPTNFDCSVWVHITNLPSWNGVTNPTTTRALVWLDVEQNDYGPIESDGPDVGLAPVAVTNCTTSGSELDVLYDERFYDAQDSANEQLVHVGEVGVLHVEREGKPETWTFGNGQNGCLWSLVQCGEGYPFYYYTTQAPAS